MIRSVNDLERRAFPAYRGCPTSDPANRLLSNDGGHQSYVYSPSPACPSGYGCPLNQCDLSNDHGQEPAKDGMTSLSGAIRDFDVAHQHESMAPTCSGWYIARIPLSFWMSRGPHLETARQSSPVRQAPRDPENVDYPKLRNASSRHIADRGRHDQATDLYRPY